MKNLGYGDNSYQTAPVAAIEYFADNPDNVINRVQDLTRKELTAVFSNNAWLKFTLLITWNGDKPEERLQGGPVQIPSRLGLRYFQFDTIKINIVKAFNIAAEALPNGEHFIGNVSLYWVLHPGVGEPSYEFRTNTYGVIRVGAYTGKVEVPETVA